MLLLLALPHRLPSMPRLDCESPATLKRACFISPELAPPTGEPAHARHFEHAAHDSRGSNNDRLMHENGRGGVADETTRNGRTDICYFGVDRGPVTAVNGLAFAGSMDPEGHADVDFGERGGAWPAPATARWRRRSRLRASSDSVIRFRPSRARCGGRTTTRGVAQRTAEKCARSGADDAIGMRERGNIGPLARAGTAREPSREDFVRLFQESGFPLSRVLPTKGLTSIIEGIAASRHRATQCDFAPSVIERSVPATTSRSRSAISRLHLRNFGPMSARNMNV
jgi:hypothetical protein